jgi:hypothetical protein
MQMHQEILLFLDAFARISGVLKIVSKSTLQQWEFIHIQNTRGCH